MSDLKPVKLTSLDSYPGGKGADGTFQRLINQIPPHSMYVEPFLGGGAIMRHKRPAQYNHGYELAPDVVEVWKREGPPWCNVFQEDAMLLLRNMARGVGTSSGIFLFVDPPYLGETLKSGVAPYEHRMSYDDHVELLLVLQDIAKRSEALMMVCALPNMLYENQLKGWRTMQYENKTRRGMQTEQVWMNYPEPTVLHDYRYVGSDYRERERIRKVQRNRARIMAAMPPLERQALLDHLNRTFSHDALPH